VALHRSGDSGEPVRDIQERLTALGFSTDPDPSGVFGEGTEEAVEEFQKSRNLTPDGLVGRETWRIMVDAGFRPGDRLLYYRLPMLHGDDVATLQQDLGALGFDAGIVDGIFGPQTLRAVLDFQQNRQMAEDGIAGPRTIAELAFVVRATRKMGRDQVRERQWLRSLPVTIAGQRVVIDPFCRDDHEAERSWLAAGAAAAVLRDLGGHPVLSRSADTRPAERNRAQHANEIAADMVIAFALPRTDVPGVFFFASSLSRSEAGEELATEIGRRLGLDSVGRTMPILQGTRAPAIVVAAPRLDAALGAAVANGIQTWLENRRQDHSPASDR
jgi:N-acetylmuramoyl-L-alanine amidase